MKTEEKKYCVYLITNLVNGKQYAGQTCKKLSVRWGNHKAAAKMGINTYLYHAMTFYGVESFLICLFRENLSEKEADQEERLLIETLKLDNPEFGYNMTKGGEGTIPNEETRRRMIQNSGIKRRDISIENVVHLYRSGMAQEKIGETLGASRRTVSNRLKEAKEPLRSISESHILRYGLGIESKEIVYLYQSGQSLDQIVDILGISNSAVRLRLDKEGVKRRSGSEGKILRHGKGLDNQVIFNLREEGVSAEQIASRFGVNKTTIFRRLAKFKETK